MENLILELDPGKVTGNDKISPQVLKNCEKELPEPLANLHCLPLGEVVSRLEGG